ncbi:hypothetical protein [Acidicapsa acidisoli]|nr:hypothetical protein [Acidicapsa acidisoli]
MATQSTSSNAGLLRDFVQASPGDAQAGFGEAVVMIAEWNRRRTI